MVQLDNAKKASDEDDEKDEDGDGIADVEQITPTELVQRKIKVYFEATDPEILDRAFAGVYSGWAAIIAVLKLQVSDHDRLLDVSERESSGLNALPASIVVRMPSLPAQSPSVRLLVTSCTSSPKFRATTSLSISWSRNRTNGSTRSFRTRARSSLSPSRFTSKKCVAIPMSS